MKRILFMGAGAVIAALVAHPASAQEEQIFTQNQNVRSEIIQRSINEGIPRNYPIPRQAPSLGLGNIYGLNPCAAGVSVGVSTPVGAIGGAFSTIDDECQIRNNAAILVSGLRDEGAAREVLCTIKTIREAFIRVGRPCIFDGGQTVVLPSNYPAGAGQAGQYSGNDASGAGQLPPNAMPPVTAPQRSGVSADPERRVELPVNVPAFCYTPGLSIALYPECSGQQVSTQPRAPSIRPTAQPRSAPTPPQASGTNTPAFNPATGHLGNLSPLQADGPALAASSQARPFLGNAMRDATGCAQTSATIRRLYAECVAADRHIAQAAARDGTTLPAGSNVAMAGR